ncbi:MAG: hypothetical protein JO079_06780 [Frankiaceae bacterium]|nr:hypothetical protein [Frankiaceae bacterium]MBV9368463.1 hypothetical protein [Frankiales bacterium]
MRLTTRRWVLRTAFAATATTLGLVASGTVLTPASADPPSKVAWWTQGGGKGAPAPDVKPGGLRVAVGPQAGIVSYGAVEYAIPKDGSGTLELAITQSTPTPPQPPAGGVTLAPLGNVQACPTKGDSWKSGDNQDIATAPAYDCSTYHFAGAPSADGKTMTFLIDGSADQTPGTMSLAIVPVQTTALYTAGTDAPTDSTPPFFVDFDKPAETSLQLDTSSVVPPTTTYTPPPSSGGSSGGGGTTPTTTNTGGGTTVPSVPLSGTGTVATDTTTGQTPVVAGQQQQQTQNYAAPVANSTPAGLSQNRRDLLLVLLMLMLFGILYTQNMAARPPRALAGPRAGEAVAAGAGAAAVPAAMAQFMPSRGLGRFAKPRSGQARPLI